jgi:transcription-repair coupling factor (superfamily II helicase)
LIHPAVRDLFLDLAKHPGFQDAVRRAGAAGATSRTGGKASLSGLTTAAKALYSVLLWHYASRPVLLVTDGNKQAEALAELVETFFSLLAADGRNSPQLLPALDVLPLQNLSPHAEILEQRAIGLWRLATERVPITVLPVPAALQRIAPGEYYRQLALRLRVGDEIPLEDVLAHLESIGYERREPVEMVGEYSVRGGILDVFSPEAPRPVRIDLFGDLVESIRRFDVESQRSVLKIEECTLLPLSEYQKSRALLGELNELMDGAGPPGEPFPGWELLTAMVRPQTSSVFSLLANPVIVWDEPEQVSGAAERFWKRLEQIERTPAYDPEKLYFRWEDLKNQVQAAARLDIRELDLDWDGEARFHVPTRPAMTFHGNMQVAIAEARNLVESGQRVAFFAATTGEVERLADILNEYGLTYQLGLEQGDSTPAYLAERAYMAGTVASVYLVKGLVRLHGGELRIYSRIGEGTRVSVQLPLDARKLRRHARRCLTLVVDPRGLSPAARAIAAGQLEAEHRQVSDAVTRGHEGLTELPTL